MNYVPNPTECTRVARSVRQCNTLTVFELAIPWMSSVGSHTVHKRTEIATLLSHLPPTVRHVEFFIIRMPNWNDEGPYLGTMFHTDTWTTFARPLLDRRLSELQTVIIELEQGVFSTEWMQTTLGALASAFRPDLPIAQSKHSSRPHL